MTISGNQLIGSLLYRTREALRNNDEFLEGLQGSPDNPYGSNYFINGLFNIKHYPGTVSEIKNTLLGLDAGAAFRSHKYPACFNFVPRIEYIDNGVNYTTFNLAFTALTDANWLTEQRERYVFDPVLRPIYREFMNQCKRHMSIYPRRAQIPAHRKIEVFTTGNVSPGSLVAYPDWIDAIEIQNLQLNYRDCHFHEYDRVIEENKLLTILN